MRRVVLAYIKTAGPASAAQIVEALQISDAGADDLVAQGFVIRSPDGTLIITRAGSVHLDESSGSSDLTLEDGAAIDAAFAGQAGPGSSFPADVLAAGYTADDAGNLAASHLEFAVRISAKTGNVGILVAAVRRAKLAHLLRDALDRASSN